MLHYILTALWDSAFAQFGIAGLTLIGSVAAFIWVPGTKHIAVGVGSVCVVFLFLGPKLYIEGVSHEKAVWVAAEEAAVKRGTDARATAEKDVDSGNTGRGGVVPFRVRNNGNDKYDRDAGAVRGVAPNPVQQPKRHAAHRPASPRPQQNGAAIGVLGVVQPAATPPCWRVKQAFKTLSKENIDALANSATPEQRAAAEKCLAK